MYCDNMRWMGGGWNDKFSSIRFGTNVRSVKVYEHWHYEGA